MNKPRVESLVFNIVSDAHTQYDQPKVMEFMDPLGRFKVEPGMLTFWPAEEFSSVDDAKMAVAPFLHDWEMHAAIQTMPGVLMFRFDRAQVIEPPVLAGALRSVQGTSAMALRAKATATAILSRYPSPPSNFRVTTEVETAFRRWRGYREGREPLLSMAYYIYTIFVPKGGRSRPEAATLFAVEERVLSLLSGLSSIRGGSDDARKFSLQSTAQLLKDQERAWLEETVRRLIYRLGEQAGGATLALIRIQDLPQPPPAL